MGALLPVLIGHLEALLNPGTYEDYGPNGLQVPGPREIDALVTGVSAGAELFERAADAGADLVLVHHGLFWQGPPRPMDTAMKRRLELLFDNEMALAAYHLPLDGHLEHGNNALLAAGLGCNGWEPFAHHRGGATIGVRGRFDDGGVGAETLVERVRELTGRAPLAFLDGPQEVRSIGIVSGAGSDYLEEAIALGLDAFLTGEPIERAMNAAREAGVHYLAAGHYATETFGVRRLGELLEREFGVRHEFVDVPNPI